jgi:hypothetical protein
MYTDNRYCVISFSFGGRLGAGLSPSTRATSAQIDTLDENFQKRCRESWPSCDIQIESANGAPHDKEG